MFRLSAARMLGGYREIFPCSQDYDFFWRMAELGSCVNLSDPLYHYRFAVESVSAKRAADQVRVHAAARRLAETRKRGAGQTDEAAAAALAEADHTAMATSQHQRAALKQADHLLLAGHYKSALREYARLVRQHPADWLGWAKFARGVIFAGVPAAREACFS
jgi:AraC-like DNA-binding protein